MLTYTRWMAGSDSELPALLVSGLNSAALIKALARFRMELHELQIEQGRYAVAGQRQRRSQRACGLCGELEDEAHLIFDRPADEEAWVRAHVLFWCIPRPEEADLDVRMRELMNPPPSQENPRFWHEMADLLVACFETRTVCVHSNHDGRWHARGLMLTAAGLFSRVLCAIKGVRRTVQLTTHTLATRDESCPYLPTLAQTFNTCSSLWDDALRG
jgi:hypothetical protein